MRNDFLVAAAVKAVEDGRELRWSSSYRVVGTNENQTAVFSQTFSFTNLPAVLCFMYHTNSLIEYITMLPTLVIGSPDDPLLLQP